MIHASSTARCQKRRGHLSRWQEGKSVEVRSGPRGDPKRLERNESPSMSRYEQEPSMLVSDVM